MLQYFDILKEQYDKDKFQKFSLELLNSATLSVKKLEIDQHFTPHIESLTYLGLYEDPQGKKLHILDVNLKTQTKLEQARTMQRNLIAKYLKDHWLDSALVAFHTDASDSWRLSFVKVEYRFDEQGKTKEELTPAKRYSFLVGEGEPTHTAQTQLAKIYQQTATNPTLVLLEEAFGIEKVTKEFFEKYRELFESVLAELKSNHTFQNEAVKNNIDTPSFAKKLLGQIVFLYFLQKKGWLGVPRGKSWGEGDRLFLGNLFRQAQGKGENFFNNYLEVLFYDTLNNPRRNEVDPSYSKHFDSKVPFLNGGLFEPQYDWKNSMMYLDNKVFEKILGVFDQYNFTVKEDEPLEKEVAVDPEMLGKVFENLLEENLRKGKGTYYTPREIVHYMCEESLINYLGMETGLKPDDIRSKYFPTYNVLGDERFEARDVNVSEEIIESLEKIKIVDPACGSGAFLVGMLQQITQLRYELETRSKLLGRRDNASTEYEIKKQTIQNCIYGVDIDPGAIEIAKLRLWLSLVVDYDLEQIEPLPNLDYKLMQGNSLLEDLVIGDTSIKLFDVSAIKNVNKTKKMRNLFEVETRISLFDVLDESTTILKDLKRLQYDYFNQSDSQTKRSIKEQIDKIEQQLIESSVREELSHLHSQKLNVRSLPGIGLLRDDVKRLEKISSKESQIMAVLNEFNKTGTKPFFLWHLYFSDVFEEKGGFDIVIANPPYVEFKKLKKEDKEKLIKYYSSARGKFDLYVVFLELAAKLLNKSGDLAFIMPTMFMKRDYGEAIRDFITRSLKILKIFDFADIQVFDSATNYTGVFFLTKNNLTEYKFDYKKYKDIGRQVLPEEFEKSLRDGKTSKLFDDIDVSSSSISSQPWSFNLKHVDALFEKLKKNATPLADLVEAFFEGIASGKDEVFYINKDTIDKYQIEESIVYKLLRGIDVKKYLLNWSGTYVIYPYDDNSKVYKEDYLADKYPHVYSYLKSKRVDLGGRPYFKNSSKLWYELWNQRDIEKLKQMRIVTPEISRDNNFAFCEGYFGNTKTYNLVLRSKNKDDYFYYLGLLNSRLIEFFYRKSSVPKAGGYIEYKKQFLDNIPIKSEEEMRRRTIEIVSEILSITSEKDHKMDQSKLLQITHLEEEIDQLVYKLYGLSDTEIQIVEGKND